jgi:membrane-associated phospholipid phosphatase
MLNIIRRNKFTFIAFLLLWTSFLVWVLMQGKKESFLLINLNHTEVLDVLIPSSTYLGDGIFAVVLGLLLMFKNYRASFVVLTAFLVSGILAQFLKLVVFPDMLRPLAFFEELGIDIHTIEGIKMRRHYSFPSGHTTSAFSKFMSLIILFQKNWLSAILLLLACLAGYSRIYLGQHFPEDVLFGSMIGTSIAILSVNYWERSKWKFLDSKPFNKQ